MELSIIIPTKDRGKIFDETIGNAMEAINHLDAEIIVINDSKQNTPNIPDHPKVRLFNNPKQGVASARNLGFKQSKGDIILFIDDDILISRISVDHILSMHREKKGICLNVNWEYPPELKKNLHSSQFGRFLLTHQMTSFKGWYGHESWRDNTIFASTSVASFHLSLARSDFGKTAGYNENFPFAGFEDYDFPLSLKRAGLLFFIDTRITVFHNEKDKLDQSHWLFSQERRSITRRAAVTMGYTELALDYPAKKRILLVTLNKLFGALNFVMKVIPNHSKFDFLYFRLLSIQQAAKIFKGYSTTT